MKRFWNKKKKVFSSNSLAAISIKIHELHGENTVGWAGEDQDYKLEVEVIFCSAHSSA